MKRWFPFAIAGLIVCTTWSGPADGRGFGGFRGGFSGGYSGGRSGSYGSFSGSRSFSGYSGFRSGGASGSADRSYTSARGGSVSMDTSRSAYSGFFGGKSASSSRTISGTTASGQSFSHTSDRSAAEGPRGRYAGGSEHYGSTSGPRGAASGGWQTAYAGRAFPTDHGMAHYSSFGAVSGAHSTAFWSHGYCTAHAGYVRTGFGYGNAFHPAWYGAHPGCWTAAAWTGAAAWRTATWASVAAFCGMAASGGGGGDDSSSAPTDYDYGSNVVYQDGNVYDNGQQVATAQQYSQQATALADQGQKADPPPSEEWKALGVFAMVQGDEKTSNNIFQLAINKQGIIRGNYYDGLMDTTTQVYGSVDRKSQRAAWTIGKDKKRVFEAGLGNLTKDETPMLVHIGADKTQQWLLVRMAPPKNGDGAE